MTPSEIARLHGTWRSMIARCANAKNPDYGGRGIKVCDRWRLSFDAFVEDMGPKPTPEHSLDRIDVNGNYEPGNCRWATAKVQANNRRRSGRLPLHGKAKTRILAIRFTAAESALIDEALALTGKTFSEWAREIIMAEVRRIIADAPLLAWAEQRRREERERPSQA